MVRSVKELNNNVIPRESNFLLYATSDGEVRVAVLLQNETVWLTQRSLAELFGVEVNTINYHVKEILKSAELPKASTIRKFRIVQNEGQREIAREIEFYNLDFIISVGYRVNSEKAMRFRIWATKTLRDYIVKGYIVDDRRLKQGNPFGRDYFDELLEKIREIRASERRFYQKITDLYAEGSVDYDRDSKITQHFFQTVQNKLHWAITGQTAAELIAGRVSSKKSKMGLTTWKNAPQGKILKTDVFFAKNYLKEEEISELNRIVTMYLDYAENQARKQRVMTMKDWVEKLDAFLQFNEYDILDNQGKVSHEVAKKLAEKEFEKYRIVQDQEYVSDFDSDMQKYLKQGKKSPVSKVKKYGKK